MREGAGVGPAWDAGPVTTTSAPAPVADRPVSVDDARWRPAVAGLAAGLMTVGVAELAAALLVRTGRTQGTPDPIVAVGAAFIDRTPPWLKDFAVLAFGTHDKQVLLAGIVVVLALAAAGAGVLAAHRRVAGLLVVAALGAIAGAAVLSRPDANATDVLPILLGAVVGMWALRSLLDRERATHGPTDLRRRAFVRQLLLMAVVGGAASVVAQAVAAGSRAARASRARLRLPAPTGPVPAGQELANLRVPGLSPLVTSPEDFYRIDTALVVPQVDAGQWRLRVHGMVKQELELDLPALLALPLVERMVTLTCVSNEVGGDLAGNQVWRGALLRDLLARARPTPDADMVLSTSADGWTAGTPLDALTDPGRDAMLAVAMGGQPLPMEHGFPVRMVVPGLYGYVSATKWVVDLEVTRFDRAEGYWTPRGWSARGPVKTASRIDVPRGGADVRPGQVVVAGVAWAQHRGIGAVEVRVDEGPWQRARLGDGGNVDTWRQWVWTWRATPGEHALEVRAVDGRGAAQTGREAPPAPDGATGWHTVNITVRD
jgi:DMSO/TMAO reductase YedYZ molybdopterin-dependent catalytic subunit